MVIDTALRQLADLLEDGAVPLASEHSRQTSVNAEYLLVDYLRWRSML
jgi:hypothetical protein